MTLVRETTIGDDGEIRLKGLPLPIGDHVQVIIITKDQATSASHASLKGIPVRYDRPFEPAIDPDEWEANR